ncbi:MAG: secretin N-terminal domain-containing protein, partial [Planctomycetota bacterium]
MRGECTYRWVAICVVCAMLSSGVASWQEAGEPGAAAPVATDPAPIYFNFKGASFEQVIDFFSRSTGLPVVWETPPPEGTLDYLSPEAYDLPEALRVLNIILQSKGVMLRVRKDMLHLQQLTEMQREDIPTYVGELPGDVGDEQIITVVRPLDIALAKPLAERLAELIASYGAVSALEQQNALVITETGSQVRRILQIVEQLDREDPEGAIEIFVIQHARATTLMEPLKALLAQKVEKFVIDQKGKQVKIEEDSMPGLSITADERTNSIVAKGVQSRIDKLREVIALLDVPASNGGRSVRTISLGMLSPEQARSRLEEIYLKLPEEERPAVIAMNELGSVTIVGSESAIAEGITLLKAIDGGEADDGAEERGLAVIALEHADPPAVMTALKTLLNGRQVSATRLVPGPDGRSLIIAAPMSDIESVRAVIPALDRPARADRQVRVMRVSAPDPAAALERTHELFEKQVDLDDPAMEMYFELDAASRTVTLVGTVAALDRFTGALRMVESNIVIERETRQIAVANVEPSRIAGSLASLARPLLTPADGTPYHEPTIVPVDPLQVLMITAASEQMAVLDSLVTTLDRPGPADFQFRVIPLTGISDVERLLERAREAYARLTVGYESEALPDPEVEIDLATGNLMLSGRTEAVRRFEQAVAEARRLLPPDRSGRMVTLRQARASDVLEPLRDLIDRTAPIEAGRAVPPPRIEVIEPTNSLFVVAEAPQHQMIQQLVRELDTLEPTDLPPLRLLQVRAADANQLATMLRQRYDARPSEQRREQPVTINADAGTNTLVVTAHTLVFDEIKEFVDTVNRAGEAGAERETMIYPLKRARATDLATALDKLYPQPPMPLDRRGRPMPHLREPKEVHVSADAATNTLIVEAPVERRASFEALVEQLDRVELPPTAELRTYYIDRGEPNDIARTLSDLARQGVLSAPAAEGGKAVEVIIQAEPRSRTLIVAGDEVTFMKVEEVLEDLKAVPVPRDLRVIEVTGADPQSIADRALAIYDEQTASMRDAGDVSIEVDRAASVLYLVADPEAMVRMVGIVNQLQTAIGPPPDVRLVSLEYAEATEVVTFLEGLAASELATAGGRTGPPPVFEAIERTNSVLIAAAPSQHQVIESLIRALDVPEDQSMPPLRILQLRTADAGNLSNALM